MMMTFNLGPLLKEIRNARKITLQTLADGTLSVSQLSKFENGITTLTVNKLLPLLNKLNVTYEEFFVEANAYHKTEIEHMIINIKKYYMKNDRAALEKLCDEQHARYEKTHILFHKLNTIMIASILEELTNEKYVTDEMRESLAAYFFEVEEWRFYEVMLFGNSMHTLTLDMLKLITTELMKSPILSAKTARNKQMRIQTLYNVALTMIENDSLEFAKTLIDEMNTVLEKDESLILEHIKLRYLKGYYAYMIGRQNEGKEMMKETIDTFHLYNCVHLAQNFEAHYKASIQ